MIAQLKELVGELQARLRRQEEASTRSRKHTANSAGDHGESYKKLRADYQRLLTTRIDVSRRNRWKNDAVRRI